MWTKLIFTTFIFLLTNTNAGFSFVKFFPGMKTGINFSRQYFVSGVQEFYGYPKYNYPTDLLLSVYSEFKISKLLSIITEFMHIKTSQEVTFLSSDEDGILFLEKAQYTYFRIPLLLKFSTNMFAKPYFLIGPDFGYLQNVEYLTYGVFRDYYTDFRMKNTENLPKFDTSVDLGLGRKFEVMHADVILETRITLGLTIYDLHIGYPWRNRGIQFIMGVQLK